jgi:hypothetical protein
VTNSPVGKLPIPSLRKAARSWRIYALERLLVRELLVPKNGYLTLSGRPGLGVELAGQEEPQRKFPYDPQAPGAVPNPRFPKAWDRATAREEQNRRGNLIVQDHVQ